MTRSKRLLKKLNKAIPNVDGTDNEDHDKYHNQGIPHTHKPGG